jgi:hypothetical protein
MVTIFMVFGIILGIALLCGVVYGIQYMVLTRKSLGVPPEPPNTVALAKAMGPIVGGNAHW